MTLKEELKKIKKLEYEKTDDDWETYKEEWQSSISKIQNIISFKWFDDYKRDGLMAFAVIPSKRIDPYIGEYATTTLEIMLVGNKYIVLEPETAITAEYDGKLNFYMLGNVKKKVSILRKVQEGKEDDWIVASSNDTSA